MTRSLAHGTCVGVALIVLLGFFGISYDNYQYLLGAYRLADPSYLSNDWFLNGTTSFHPTFELFVLTFLRMDQLELGLFVWFAVNAMALGLALVAMAQAVSGRAVRWPVLFSILAVVLVGNKTGWGWYELLTPQAMPSNMANPLALFAVAMLLSRRFAATAVAIAALFFIHRGFAALMIPLLVLPFLATLPLQRREWFTVAGAAGALVLLLLPVVLHTQDLDSGHKDALKILFYGRAPHHYAIQYSPLSIHLASLHLILAGLGSAMLLPSRAMRLRILALIGSLCLGFAFGYVFLELWYVPDLVRLFPYRAYPLLVAVVAVTASTIVFDDDDVTPARRSAAAALILSLLAFSWSIELAFALMALAPVAYWVARRHAAWPRRISPVTLGACLVAMLAGLWNSPPDWPSPWPSDLGKALSEAFNSHVPEDAILVVPPELPVVRIEARRAIVVDYKAFPVYGKEMLAWADRMHAVTGVDPKSVEPLMKRRITPAQAYKIGYNRRTLPDLLRAARYFGADFALVHEGSVFEQQAAKQEIAPTWEGVGLLLFDLKKFPT